PAKKILERFSWSSLQCSRIAPGADAPVRRVWSRVARGESVAARGAPGRLGRERSARLRFLPERALPANAASVRSAATLELRLLQAFHSGVSRSVRCSGLGMRAGF